MIHDPSGLAVIEAFAPQVRRMVTEIHDSELDGKSLWPDQHLYRDCTFHSFPGFGSVGQIELDSVALMFRQWRENI